MSSSAFDEFISEQSEQMVKLYRAGQLLVAVESSSTLTDLRGSTIHPLGRRRDRSAFISETNGIYELWCNPTYGQHREAMAQFAREQNSGIMGHELASFDSDHLFAESAALDRTRVHGGKLGFVRINFVRKDANRSFGTDWEKRFRHRYYETYCEANLADLLKGAGFKPRTSWTNPAKVWKDGVLYLFEKGYINREDIYDYETNHVRQVFDDHMYSAMALVAREDGSINT